jgi:hypothetical protein
MSYTKLPKALRLERGYIYIVIYNNLHILN